jgi:hypothetical protein
MHQELLSSARNSRSQASAGFIRAMRVWTAVSDLGSWGQSFTYDQSTQVSTAFYKTYRCCLAEADLELPVDGETVKEISFDGGLSLPAAL